MYDCKSIYATEFIDDGEILATIAYAQENKRNRELIDAILERAKDCKGITHREAAVLLECDLEDEIKNVQTCKRDQTKILWQSYSNVCSSISF